MKMLQRMVTSPLEKAGIDINGDRPFDIQIHNDRIYSRVALEGSLGLGESYMDGDWDCDDLPEFFNRLLRTGADRGSSGLTGTLFLFAQKLWNQQSITRSVRVAKQHYDLPAQFYANMLDPRMVYTCGYWANATTLAEAQEAKLDLICRKIGLNAGQIILDVGCGYGSFAKFAAEKYGATVVGITLSEEQLVHGTKLCEGLPVDLRLMDYRDLPKHFKAGHFDHIVSIGMFEHVGPKNHAEYMRVLSPLLKPEGLFLLHTIGGNDHGGSEPWIERYIFPGGWIPSLKEITSAVNGNFIIEDLHNFGTDYDKTLCAWDANFVAAWPKIKGTEARFNDRFYRMWRYYLGSCAGTVRGRTTQLYQFVLSPNGVKNGYESVR
ncbi:MAG: Cyclopropane-fatty-acyl-phospholipid synthase [Parcubacteria group bacterium]|nr:Cyclopropane-fatty-acyl-phospholipid synthase [Parcubacteria group bacterium]